MDITDNKLISNSMPAAVTDPTDMAMSAPSNGTDLSLLSTSTVEATSCMEIQASFHFAGHPHSSMFCHHCPGPAIRALLEMPSAWRLYLPQRAYWLPYVNY